MLITAGPTHEPIDAVRFLGNRSSGKLGVSLALAAAARAIQVTLLLGPVAALPPPHPSLRLLRFTTCEDLRLLLSEHAATADVLVMAAAVADFRPRPLAALSSGKFRRTSQPVHLELEPTPDLLAHIAASKRGDQVFVGFALEPRDGLLQAARMKLERKGVDIVVANPLETMESDEIEATVIGPGNAIATPGLMSKSAFAQWLLDRLLGSGPDKSPVSQT